MSVFALIGRRAMQGLLSVATLNRDLTFNENAKKAEAKCSGLLVGASENFFTSNLDMIAAAKMVDNSDAIFRRAIEKDAECAKMDAGTYLRRLEETASHYLEENDICGRAAIREKIRDAILERGSLTFITGGISLGKSKIMANIIESISIDQASGENPPTVRVSVVMVDGRKKQDLKAALRTVAAGQGAALMNNGAKIASTLNITLPVGCALGFDFTGVNFAEMDIGEAVDSIANKVTADTHHAFMRSSAHDPASALRANALLDALVWNTKQTMRMSVLLVSSDEGLPNRVQDLGVSADHITGTLVISEPTPHECADLLEKKLGVGEHLRTALLDSYGGNVYQMCMFVERLPADYRAESDIRIFMGPATGISRAMTAWKAGENKSTEVLEAEILKVLEELARTGFVPMEIDNKLAQLLTKFNVCAFLTKGAKEYQVPKEVRAKRAGLIPSSQLVRVLIASELAELEATKKIKAEESQAGK